MGSTPGTIYADNRFTGSVGILPLTCAQQALFHQELQWAFDAGVEYGRIKPVVDPADDQTLEEGK